MAENQHSKPAAVDTDLILELNFVPQWARKPADEARYRGFEDRDSDRSRRGRSGGGPGGGRDPAGRSRDPRDQRPRPRPREDSVSPRRDSRSESPVGGMPPPRQPSSYSPGAPSRARREHEPVPAAPVTVRFLPEQQALAGLVRQVSSTKRAYPLIELATLLLSKPGFCFVRLDIESEAADAMLYQCKVCRTIALDRGQLEAHVLSEHTDAYFDVEEVEGDTPSGTFVCVAKCGYSGVLLGPPNHHSYNDAVRRIHASRFANLDFNAYKDRIQLSHAPEDVERWKVESSKTVEYRLKEGSEEERAARSASEVERYMRDNVLPKAVLRTKRAVVTEDIAHKITDMAIKRALREEWMGESRFPLKMSFALRAAFKHKHLYIFKAGKGRGGNFVTTVQPAPLDPERAIPEIRDALSYLREHPGTTREQMVAALRPDDEPDSDAVKALLQPLHWLVDRGHIIEFFNGTLAVPLSRR